MERGQELYRRAKKRIPGGTQLLSKRPELFHPERWPPYYRRAKGVQVEDLDGRVFVDIAIHAVGACPLGYADPDVERAVIDVVRTGNMSSLNAPEEVELADLLCALHPWAGMVRYTRSGGEAMAVAVRIARAATGRDRIAFSGYHGWHDWYLSANLSDAGALDSHLLRGASPAGVPKTLAGTAVPFAFGDLSAVQGVVETYGQELAAIVIEPARYEVPPPGYLERVQELARRCGAVLVVDEITCGFRMQLGGFHLGLGIEPDIAVFAKAISNGYPMGVILGRREVMEAAQRSFISSTYWTDRIGPAAALATIAKLDRLNVPVQLAKAGERMREGWLEAAATSGLRVETTGLAPLPRFSFDHGDKSGVMRTLYTQFMLEEGYLAGPAFYASYAHEPAHIDAAVAATERSFVRLSKALESNSLDEQLQGELAGEGLARGARGKGRSKTKEPQPIANRN
jgi:glutamate-1-semialdehyde 2,1-aminomutase